MSDHWDVYLIIYFFFSFHFIILHGRKETVKQMTLCCVNLSRTSSIAKSTALARNRFRDCAGFHNANYDRFTLPLRKCTSQRRRAGYRFLRTPKLQLRSRVCFIRHDTWRHSRRVIHEVSYVIFY